MSPALTLPIVVVAAVTRSSWALLRPNVLTPLEATALLPPRSILVPAVLLEIVTVPVVPALIDAADV